MDRTRGWVAAVAMATTIITANGARGDLPVWEQASRTYESAMSSYVARQWNQAQGLFEVFVTKHSTHENVPLAYLRLAHCREQQKDPAGCDAALREVVKRFEGSPAWYRAYAYLLEQARQKKDTDAYFTLLRVMARRTQELPLDLRNEIAFWRRSYWNEELNREMLWPHAAQYGRVVQSPGWVLGVAELADTPELATQAIGMLNKTIRAHHRELPGDWQFTHVTLLRLSERAEDADKQRATHLEQWTDDPRGLDYWLAQAEYALRRQDDPAADEAWGHILKHYLGHRSLATHLYDRLDYLYEKDRWQDFNALLPTATTQYLDGRQRNRMAGWLRRMATRGDAKEQPARLAAALATLDKLGADKDPEWQRSRLFNKLDLTMRLGQVADGLKLAEQVCDESQWSSHAFNVIERYARSHKAFEPLLASLREKYGIPEGDPDSEASKLLAQLRTRIKDDQTRHMEEIGTEMFTKHRDAAETIHGVRLLVDYYYRKVLPEPRDAWAQRMIATYPQHPLTEHVLNRQIAAEYGAKRYDVLARLIDTAIRRFPGQRYNGTWFNYRLACYHAQQDHDARIKHAREYFAGAVDAGDMHALERLGHYEEDYRQHQPKPTGDFWMEAARRTAGTQAEVYALRHAWYYYYWRPWRSHRDEVCWNEARQVAEALVNQQVDPESRWGSHFADINLMACQRQGKEALEALQARIAGAKSYYDLSLRLDFANLGLALGETKLSSRGVTLAGKLRRLCASQRDKAAIDEMLGNMHRTAGKPKLAAKHFLMISDSSPFPARAYPYFQSALSCMRSEGEARFTGVAQLYIKRIPHVQDVLPKILHALGNYYYHARNRKLLSVRKTLSDQYPDSASRGKVEELVETLRKQQREKNRK